MSRTTGRIAIVGLAGVLLAAAARAQITIHDPAVVAKESVIADLASQLLDVLTQQATRFDEMAKRLSAMVSLDRYRVVSVPHWWIHPFQGEQFLYADPYNAALNAGDPSGDGFETVSRTRLDPSAALGTFDDASVDAETVLRSQLATLDAADSTVIAGTDQTGQLRLNGPQELAAIDTLEHDTVDPSPAQSTTAVLDKISGAALIRARQQQARIQFLAAMTEQLLVDNKRDRDAETAAMNMQLERLRSGADANAALVSGLANDLRTWRQP